MVQSRREIASQRALMQTVAQATVASASNASVITVQIGDAISGDLIAASPTLRAKLEQVDNRLNELEQPIP